MKRGRYHVHLSMALAVALDNKELEIIMPYTGEIRRFKDAEDVEAARKREHAEALRLFKAASELEDRLEAEADS